MYAMDRRGTKLKIGPQANFSLQSIARNAGANPHLALENAGGKRGGPRNCFGRERNSFAGQGLAHFGTQAVVLRHWFTGEHGLA